MNGPGSIDSRRVAQFESTDGQTLASGAPVGPTNPSGGIRIVSRRCEGQALVEYALTLPFILLLVVNVVNFGGFFYGWITMANAARAGAEYAILGGASVGAIEPANGGQIINMITQDISSLPNSSTLVVSICQNYNGTITSLAGSCSAIPTDPEPTNYVLTTVDTTYTYKPFIPAGFQFPGLGIYATLPPTTVHRRTVMRSIQ